MPELSAVTGLVVCVTSVNIDKITPNHESASDYDTTLLCSPSEVKEGDGNFAQLLRRLPLFVGVWGSTGILVQHPEQSQAQYGLQWEHSYRDGEVDAGTEEDRVSPE